nr:hypothetical protein [Tanacetum cinerariifolium]
MMKPDHQDPNALKNLKPWRKCCFRKFIMNSYYGKVATKMRSLGCDKEIDDMLRIKLREAGSNEEIFIYVAWIRAFNIREPIYAELCHEFYSTYEFDEVCADDELQTKKIIKFRLGGCAHILTLLEPITHMDMLNYSMISIINSTHLSHRSITSSNNQMMMSSVEMTQEKERERECETEMT